MKLIDYCRSGWPSHINQKENWGSTGIVKEKCLLSDNLLLYGARIIVPKNIREESFQIIDQGTKGSMTLLQVKNSVWWPGVSKDIEALVKSCPEVIHPLLIT